MPMSSSASATHAIIGNSTRKDTRRPPVDVGRGAWTLRDPVAQAFEYLHRQLAEQLVAPSLFWKLPASRPRRLPRTTAPAAAPSSSAGVGLAFSAATTIRRTQRSWIRPMDGPPPLPRLTVLRGVAGDGVAQRHGEPWIVGSRQCEGCVHRFDELRHGCGLDVDVAQGRLVGLGAPRHRPTWERVQRQRRVPRSHPVCGSSLADGTTQANARPTARGGTSRLAPRRRQRCRDAGQWAMAVRRWQQEVVLRSRRLRREGHRSQRHRILGLRPFATGDPIEDFDERSVRDRDRLLKVLDALIAGARAPRSTAARLRSSSPPRSGCSRFAARAKPSNWQAALISACEVEGLRR